MQFLRGDFSGKNTPLRPPWALDELLFRDACDSCGDCISACPTKILKDGRGKFPEVDFSRGECDFCEECLRVCKSGALKKQADSVPWNLVAAIDEESCLSFKGVECRSCSDPCEPRAIRMKPRIGGVSIPHLNDSECSGCGACVAVCPSQSIRVRPLQEERN